MIGNRDFRSASLANLVTPWIVPLLHKDLCIIIKEESGLNPAAFVKEVQEASDQEGNRNRSYHATADDILLGASDAFAGVDGPWLDPSLEANNPVVVGEHQATEESANGIASHEDDDDIAEEEEWSGFGGTHPKWGPKKFWNFVDSVLETIRENARTTGATVQEQQQIYNEYVAQILLYLLSDFFQSVLQGYLQRDLQNYKGNAKIQRQVERMMTTAPKRCPEWQRTIETKLVW